MKRDLGYYIRDLSRWARKARPPLRCPSGEPFTYQHLNAQLSTALARHCEMFQPVEDNSFD